MEHPIVNSAAQACCLQTLKTFGALNTYLVCSQCRRSIKWFDSEARLKMYLEACRVLKRKVQVTHDRDEHAAPRWFVVFDSMQSRTKASSRGLISGGAQGA